MRQLAALNAVQVKLSGQIPLSPPKYLLRVPGVKRVQVQFPEAAATAALAVAGNKIRF